MRSQQLSSGGIEFLRTPAERAQRERRLLERELIPLLSELVESVALSQPNPATDGKRSSKMGATASQVDSEMNEKLLRMRAVRQRLKDLARVR